MTELEYLKRAVETCGVDVATETRDDTRGATITPRRFSVARVYGDRLRKTTYRVRVTFIGEDVSNGVLFDTMEQITDEIEKDQTAGGNASQIETTEWNAQEIDKNYTVFETNITISE